MKIIITTRVLLFRYVYLEVYFNCSGADLHFSAVFYVVTMLVWMQLQEENNFTVYMLAPSITHVSGHGRITHWTQMQLLNTAAPGLQQRKQWHWMVVLVWKVKVCAWEISGCTDEAQLKHCCISLQAKKKRGLNPTGINISRESLWVMQEHVTHIK